MSNTSTPNQGFSLAQLGDPPSQLPVTWAALRDQVDAKAAGLDVDALRATSPAMVKVSVTGYVFANDPAQDRARWDTVEINRGTPTDLSKTSLGVTVNRGFWMCGLEITFVPSANNQNKAAFLSGQDPGGIEFVNEMQDWNKTLAVGYPNIGPWPGWPRQFLNLTTFGLATSDGCTIFGSCPQSCDVPYATLWAVQLGDY